MAARDAFLSHVKATMECGGLLTVAAIMALASDAHLDGVPRTHPLSCDGFREYVTCARVMIQQNCSAHAARMCLSQLGENPRSLETQFCEAHEGSLSRVSRVVLVLSLVTAVALGVLIPYSLIAGRARAMDKEEEEDKRAGRGRWERMGRKLLRECGKSKDKAVVRTRELLVRAHDMFVTWMTWFGHIIR